MYITLDTVKLAAAGERRDNWRRNVTKTPQKIKRCVEVTCKTEGVRGRCVCVLLTEQEKEAGCV